MTKRKTGSTQSDTATASKSRASSAKTGTKRAASKQASGTASKAKAKGTTANKKTARTAKSKASSGMTITQEQREMMISEAAYYNALNSGDPGQDMQHWLQAEAEIDARFGLNV